MKIYSSTVKRVKDTAEIVRDILDNIAKPIKERLLVTYGNDKYPETLSKEYGQKLNEGKTESEIIINFLDGERENKPSGIAKIYLGYILKIMKRVERKKQNFNIIAFRHGEKDILGNLTDEGKKQAKKLGNRLKQDNNQEDKIYIATHGMINESIFTTIFGRDNIPEERKLPLEFAEEITYKFSCDKLGELIINFRNKERTINLDSLEEIIKDI